MANAKQQTGNASPLKIFFRNISVPVMNFFLRATTIDPHTLLPKIESNMQKGRGLLIVFTHFGYRDPFELVKTVIGTNPVLKTKRVVIPISYHQYTLPIGLFTSSYDVHLFPVVNQDTLERKGFEHMKKGEGLSTFANEAFLNISQGGIVCVAVNAGRREFLDMTDSQRPIGYLTASLIGKGCKDFDILLIAASLQGAKSYAKKIVGGANIGKTYEFTLASYLSCETLLKKTSGKFSEIDTHVRTLFKKAVPKAYLQRSL